MSVANECPFVRAADLYFAAGFSPFPIPPRNGSPAKAPPPVGWTGHDGRWATQSQIDEWKEKAVPGTNIGIRLPQECVGIDVDNYGDAGGGQTLKQLETKYGELPPTWISTSRSDGISGIR